MSRWYDKYEKLGKHLDSLKEMEPIKRDNLIKGIMVIIKEENPDLLEDFVMEFPKEIRRRRWYDHDPYLWLLINGLKYGKEKLLKKVTVYLEENIQP